MMYKTAVGMEVIINQGIKRSDDLKDVVTKNTKSGKNKKSKQRRLPEELLKPLQELLDILRPVDDYFFQKLAEEREFCEELLQTILNDNSIRIKENVAQKTLRNVKGKSVTTDLLCQDVKRVMYGVEMQRKDTDDQRKRVRYIGSNIDTYITEKGIDYKELWDLHMIYISEFDMFKKGKTIYHIKQIVDEFQDIVENGYDETYVNTVVDDGSDIAELMKIFKSSEVPEHPKFPRICRTIRHFKIGKGREDMCEAMQSYFDLYSEWVKDVAREEGLEEGREEVIDLIISLKSGAKIEELVAQGYDEQLINKASQAIQL